MSKNTMTVMQERDLQKTTASQRIVQIAVRVIVYTFLIAMAVVVLFPFYWMIISSLKTLDEYRLSQPTFFPQTVMFSNYADAFTTASLGRLFINTMIVGVASTLLSLIITVLSAFAFARLEFKGRELLFSGLLATMMIPGELFTITNFVTVTEFGWRNTYTVLIVPFLVSVFYIFLLRQNFMQIPNELYLAAKVDGTSDLKYLWKVMVPLSLPTLMVCIGQDLAHSPHFLQTALSTTGLGLNILRSFSLLRRCTLSRPSGSKRSFMIHSSRGSPTVLISSVGA